MRQQSDATINSVGWIGSSYFLNTSGYYDYYTSMTPRSQWPYDSSRDSGYPDTGAGGYPSCKTWWSAGSSGLRARVLASFSDVTRKSLQRQFPGQQWEEVALRWLVSPQNVGQSESGTTYRIGSNDFVGTANGLFPRALSGVGLAMGQVIALPGFDAIKQALPMIQALLEMMVIIVIPVLLMFSAYEPKSVVTISFAFFALMFLTFWWELAGWLDDRLITILYTSLSEQGMGSSVPLEDFVSSTYDGWLMNLVLGMMYLVFPAFWVGMMSWVGVNIGNAMSSALERGSSEALKSGQRGGQETMNLAKNKISKG